MNAAQNGAFSPRTSEQGSIPFSRKIGGYTNDASGIAAKFSVKLCFEMFWVFQSAGTGPALLLRHESPRLFWCREHDSIWEFSYLEKKRRNPETNWWSAQRKQEEFVLCVERNWMGYYFYYSNCYLVHQALVVKPWAPDIFLSFGFELKSEVLSARFTHTLYHFKAFLTRSILSVTHSKGRRVDQSFTIARAQLRIPLRDDGGQIGSYQFRRWRQAHARVLERQVGIDQTARGLDVVRPSPALTLGCAAMLSNS